MKAIRYYGQENLAIEEMDIPAISTGEVLIRVHTCGICSTDIKTYKRGHPKISPGSVIGHEIAGTIADLKDVNGWEVGQRVVVAPYTPCMECYYCQRGYYTNCERLFEAGTDPGGFSEYVRVPARLVQTGMIAIPDGMSDAVASLTEPLACCIHGLEAVDLCPEDTLFIVGDGTMGLMQAMLARAFGVRRIALSGMEPSRLEIARGLADFVIDASQQDINAELRKFAPQGADKVMVSVGNPALVETALQYVRKSGTLNIYAGMPKGIQISIDPNLIHYDDVRLVGSFGLAPAHFAKAMQLMASGQIDPSCVISGVVDFHSYQQALIDAAEYRGIKYVLRFAGEEGSREN